jgi:predicted MFS family arabinose efflux permease
MNAVKKLFTHTAANSFGYFSPLAIMAPFLFTCELNAQQVGIILFIIAFGSKIFRILLSTYCVCEDINKVVGFNYISFAVSYFIFGSTNNFLLLCVAALLLGASFGVNFIVLKAVSLNMPSTNSTRIILSKTYIAGNAAVIVGSFLLNMMSFYLGHFYAFYTMGMIMLFFAAATYTFLFFEKSNLKNDISLLQGIKLTIKNKALALSFILTFSIWFFVAQTFSFYPLLLAQHKNLLWLILAINGLTVILLSLSANKVLEKWGISYEKSIIIAFILIAISSLITLMDRSLYAVFYADFILSVAEIIAFPALLLLIAQNSIEEQRVALLGVNALAAALGEALGNYFWTTAVDSLVIEIFISISLIGCVFIVVGMLATQLRIMSSLNNKKLFGQPKAFVLSKAFRRMG